MVTDEEFLRTLTVPEYVLMLKKAEDHFVDFVRLMHPQWKLTDYQTELCDILEKLERRELVNDKGQPVHRLLITMPPRHSKSTLCTQLFPAWFMLRNPQRKIMTSSYSGDLAKDFGGYVRNYVTHPRSAQAFPSFSLDPTTRAKDAWGTTGGGKYNAVGLGGVTTGRPANLLIVDDPVKTREEAESPTMRNKVWGFYIDSLETRKEPLTVYDPITNAHVEEPPIEIVILTRWHTDDLAGRLMTTEDWKDGRWRHVNYPAIVDEGLPTERALWPEKFPLDELKRKQRRNPAGFASLYQQRPYVEGGEIIKAGWWRYTDEIPDSFAALIIGADTAFKASEKHDPTVAVVAGLGRDGNIYILDVMRERLEFPELKRRFRVLSMKWRGKGLRGFYIEDKASGQSLIQELRSSGGVSVIPVRLPGDKVMKARLATPLIEGGQVYLPKDAPWVEAFVKECEEFPSGKHDDQVDALVIVIDALSRMVVPAHQFSSFDFADSLNAQIGTMKSDLSSWGSIWQGWGE